MHFEIYFNEIFLLCRVPTLRDQKVVKHGGHRSISLLFMSCEDHGLHKSYNGGLKKNAYRSVPISIEVVMGGALGTLLFLG